MKTSRASALPLWLIGSMLGAAACAQEPAPAAYHDIVIDRRDPRLDAIIAPDAKAEIVADGVKWAEGPVWVGGASDGYLLFTDVPGNRMHRWSRADGASVFLDPSGAPADAEGFREPGANGLIRAAEDGSILVANHGLRAVAQLDLERKKYEVLVDEFQEEPFNSPNDLALASDGAIYFTDPPYGLKGLNDSPLKRQAQNGVYRLSPSGEVSLLIGNLSFPNGVGLTPDEDALYVAVSDPAAPMILRYDLGADDIEASGVVIHDGSADVSNKEPGLPDGLAVDDAGNLFATAPGGVHIFSPEGDLLGVIRTGVPNANCAIGENGAALYIAANHEVLRVPLVSTRAQ